VALTLELAARCGGLAVADIDPDGLAETVADGAAVAPSVASLRTASNVASREEMEAFSRGGREAHGAAAPV
jgi:hypothetical protein